MIRILAVLALFMPSAAWADFNSENVIQSYNATRIECRQAESLGGTKLTKEQSDAACDRLEAIGAELKTNGFCFDQSEQVWGACKN